jgi:class 3 adenylate cyclase/tetratricopeptide (TPR) repeat protein
MRCPQCQHENADRANFCQECGQRLHLCCPACSFEVEPSAKFCPDCGHPLRGTALPPDVSTQFAIPQSYTPKHLVEKILTNRTALEGERKQVTVFFCDLANSTALAERLGPEAMHTLLNRFFELALNEVHRYEGTINQFLGDGFMALFGAPIAYEDHAPRAVLAALGLHQRFRERLANLEQIYGVELTARMGLNTGLVVVGGIGDNLRMDYTAVGDTTNLAYRLQQLAQPGTILVSKATAQMAKSYAYLETVGPVRVKGKTTPVAVYRVMGRRPRRSPLAMLGERTLSRCVGREQELATLRELLVQIEAGEGQAIGIVGETGVGKSRLLYEFRQYLRDKRVTYLEGHCLSYGSAIPYLPVIDLVRNNCGITEADSSETITQKIGLSLQEVGMDPEEWAPYLLHLLGVQGAVEALAMLSPEAIKTRIFATLRQMSLHGGRQQPIIFVVEDLHWVDKTSEACFAALVESLAGSPILFLGTYRPGYHPPWMERSYATQIALHRLRPQDSLTVVRSVLPFQELSDHLVHGILTRAEGNPFFLEELTRVVAERGELLPETDVPDTIQGVVMARIDRLPDTSKRLLQTAAVLGREVPLRLLEAMWEESGPLDPHLQELQRLEFLYEHIEIEQPVYVFKHALTQEVAYASLLTSRLQALHALAGRALEALHADRLEDVYDRLAYHYAKTAEADKAVDYLTRFAEKAARGFAHTEVVETLQEALVHAEQLPPETRDHRLLEVVLHQVHSLIFLGRFPETLHLLLQHQERLDRLQEPTLAGPYYFWLGLTYGLLGDQQRAGHSAQRALDESQRCGDEGTMGKAYYVLCMEAYWAGQPQQGVEYGRQAVALLEHGEESYWLAMAYFYLSLNMFLMGEFIQALEVLEPARVIGDTTENPRLQSLAAWITGWIYATQGEWEAGITLCQRGLDLSPDPLNTAGALGYLGTAYLEQGDAAQAIPLLEQSIQQWEQFRFPQLQGWFTALLGEAHLLRGEVEKGQDFACQGLAITRDVAFSYGVGVAQRVLGRSLQASGTLAEAEMYLKEALQSFTTMSARFEIGRTHLALAELAHARANSVTAAQHLSTAQSLFEALQVPGYVAHTTQRAKAFGLPVSEDSAR